MLNPDGVILGNYRTGIGGKDLNRQFIDPDKVLFPTVVAIKDLVYDLKRQFSSNFQTFIDCMRPFRQCALRLARLALR